MQQENEKENNELIEKRKSQFGLNMSEINSSSQDLSIKRRGDSDLI